MSLFKDATVTAAAQTAAPQEERAGIDLHLPYRPTDMVWTICGGKAVEKRVIKITADIRSLIGSGYRPNIRVTVMLEDGTIKDGSDVFMSKDELIQSL